MTTFSYQLLWRFPVSGRPSTCYSRVCWFQDDPFLLPVALPVAFAFAGFSSTLSFYLLLYRLLLLRLLVSGRPFPSTCCSTGCCFCVCWFQDDPFLLPVALPVAVAFPGFRTTLSFYLLLHLLLCFLLFAFAFAGFRTPFSFFLLLCTCCFCVCRFLDKLLLLPVAPLASVRLGSV